MLSLFRQASELVRNINYCPIQIYCRRISTILCCQTEITKGSLSKRKRFLNFVNVYLSPDRSINDLSDLSTGVELFYLLRSIYEKLGRSFPIFDKLEIRRSELVVVQKVNVNNIIEYLRKDENIPLVGINTSNVVDKDIKTIMGFLHQIITHFLSQETSSNGISTDQNERTSLYATMVGFVNTIISEEYSEVHHVDDWKNGRTLYSLLETLTESRMDEVRRREFLEHNRALENEELLKNCLEFAHTELSVPKLLTENEFTNPDQMSIAIYLSFLRNYWREGQNQMKQDEMLRHNTEILRLREEEHDMILEEKRKLLEQVALKDEIIKKLQIQLIEKERVYKDSKLEVRIAREENAILKEENIKLNRLLVKSKSYLSVSSAPSVDDGDQQQIVPKRDSSSLVEEDLEKKKKMRSGVLSKPIKKREGGRKGFFGNIFMC